MSFDYVLSRQFIFCGIVAKAYRFSYVDIDGKHRWKSLSEFDKYMNQFQYQNAQIHFIRTSRKYPNDIQISGTFLHDQVRTDSITTHLPLP